MKLYLSLHHSDDDLLKEEEDEWMVTHSLQVGDDEDKESIIPAREPPQHSNKLLNYFFQSGFISFEQPVIK